MKSGIFFLLTMTLGLFSCIDNQQEIKLVDADNFTSSINGKNVNLYTLKSKNGMTMQVTAVMSFHYGSPTKTGISTTSFSDTIH